MKYDVSLQSISWINERRTDESLELSPKFQRRSVWLGHERQELLGTICSKLPFPEVYIHVVTNHDNGKQKYIVVDGQQRITSIIKFIDGEFGLPEKTPLDGRLLKELTDGEKEAFWNYKVVVRFLYETNDAEIRDLFARLNTNNYALNEQELRNAKYSGQFKAMAERLADNPIFQELRIFSAREVRRMEDVEYVSELLVRAVVGITNKKDVLDEVYYKYNEEFPLSHEYELKFNLALSVMQGLYDQNNSIVIRTKSNFFSIFGAVYKAIELRNIKSFAHMDVIKTNISKLLLSARDGNLDTMNELEKKYADAVSRAASDKSRRETRENMIFKIIEDAGY